MALILVFVPQDLFKGFPDACNLLDTLRRGASESGSSSRWDDEWGEHVLPLLTQVQFIVDFRFSSVLHSFVHHHGLSHRGSVIEDAIQLLGIICFGDLSKC